MSAVAVWIGVGLLGGVGASARLAVSLVLGLAAVWLGRVVGSAL